MGEAARQSRDQQETTEEEPGEADKRREADDAEKKKKEEVEAAAKKVKEEAEEAERKKKEEAEAAERKEKKAADEAERKKQEQEKPKDVAVQTDKTESGDDKSVQAESGDASSTNVSDSSETPKDTAKDEKSEPTADESKPAEEKAEKKVGDHSASGEAPPDPDAAKNEKKGTKESPPPPPAYDSECDSSDSPVEDWELMYSSDDMSKKPRMAAPPPPANNDDNAVESDGESSMPEPWNAVCIVGFRVYSKDEALQLHVVMEGGELTEGGMGEKGAADIDNAQANAGGAREDKKDGEKITDEVEIIDGVPVEKKKIVVEGETDPDEAASLARGDQQDQSKRDDKDDAAKSENSDSSESSPVNTPDSTTDGSMDCSPQAKSGRSTKLTPVNKDS